MSIDNKEICAYFLLLSVSLQQNVQSTSPCKPDHIREAFRNLLCPYAKEIPEKMSSKSVNNFLRQTKTHQDINVTLITKATNSKHNKEK